MTRATFENLNHCSFGTGFCASPREIASLIIDDALLSRGSFDAILHETRFIVDVSIVGLRFSDENPSNLSRLLGIRTLKNVTVDETLFNAYADEFTTFATTDGNTLTAVRAVPEPATFAALLMGLFAAAKVSRSRRSRP